MTSAAGHPKETNKQINMGKKIGNYIITITSQQYEELKQLSFQLQNADSVKQKAIRSRMRRIGFYASNYGIEKCKVSDLERLRKGGIILIDNIKNVPSEASAISSIEKKETVHHSNIHLNDLSEVEKKLISGSFSSVNSISAESVPATSGLYCIKLRKDVVFPSKFGKVRDDGIFYIGQASKSLRERLWEEELNHNRPATFFRSLGAVLGYLPPKGSLAGKDTRNYKFSETDTEAIRKWIRQSLFVSFVAVKPSLIDAIEKNLIVKYRPLINLKHNPFASAELKAARKACVDYAKSKR